MENNFIQMAASAGHAVAYTIGPIFKNIIDAAVFNQWFHEYCRRNTYGVFFSTKKMCTLYQKMQFRVCFLKMFLPLKR